MRRTPECKTGIRFYLTAWIIVFLSLFISNCASPPQRFQPAAGLPNDGPKASHPSALEQQLRSAVHKWVGTPHRMGGTDHSGVDCSGFVQRLFRDLFGLQLPRTTADQVQYGQKIQILQTGDLVFFRTSRNVRHVGIYLGGGEFAHASKTSGVMVSRMDEQYWRDTYWTARRVLPERS